MLSKGTDGVFAGSVPRVRETYLVPLIFETFAEIWSPGWRPRPLSRVLEVADATGVVTREMPPLPAPVIDGMMQGHVVTIEQ